MATVQEAIRKLSIITVEKGTPEATAKLNALGAAHSGVAVASRKHATATGQMARELATLERRLDPTLRATQRLAAADRLLNSEQARSVFTMARRNELMALATKEHAGAAAATTAHARALAALNAQGALAGRAVLGGVGLAGGPVTAGILVAGLTLAAFVKNSVEAQKSLAQLEAVLRSTGGAAGLTAGDLTSLATEMQRVTTFGDDAVIGAEALLLTFTKIGRDVFPEAIRSVLDLSVAMGQDLKSSTVQVGKALNDPVAGITALTRVGVTFTAAQKLMIKALVDVGDVAGAQAIILRELQTEFGGSAAAARDTLGGALKALGNSFGDLFEVSGKGSERLTGSINALTNTLSDPATIKAVQDFGAALFDALAASLKVMTFLIDKIEIAGRLMQAFASGPAAVGKVIAEIILIEEAAQETAATADVMAQRFDDAFARSTTAATGTTTAIDAAREAIRQATVGAVVPMSDALEGRFTDAFGKVEEAAKKAAKAAGAVGDPMDIRPTSTAVDGLSDRFKEARGYAEGFTQSLVSGLMRGESLMGTLANSLEGLSSQLTSSAITDLFSGNFIGATVKGIGGRAAGMLQSKKERLAT